MILLRPAAVWRGGCTAVGPEVYLRTASPRCKHPTDAREPRAGCTHLLAPASPRVPSKNSLPGVSLQEQDGLPTKGIACHPSGLALSYGYSNKSFFYFVKKTVLQLFKLKLFFSAAFFLLFNNGLVSMVCSLYIPATLREKKT